ncbi:MAG: amino acid adenylation domain-containing protein [Saprospiraceae bacterium]|nr:amino acid adenylation domain-containing protein [Saprospiraceae bacterium]
MKENKHVSSVPTFPSDICLHDIFQRVVRRCPDATALVFGSESMTYVELDRRSSQLASQLTQLGIQTEDFVAIYLERSFEMIIGIFGALKAGATYVPIDVDYPTDRMAFMLEDCAAKVILTQSHLTQKLINAKAKIIKLDQPLPKIVNRKSSIVNPANLAYMIYTSGSTGKPKGCMITHENLCNQLEGQQAIAPELIGAMMLTCSISFDVSVLTIFWTLLQGAPLVLPRQGEEKDMAELADTIFRNNVTHILTLPSLYTLLLEQAPVQKLQSLKLVNVSGEVCPTSLAQKHEQIIPEGQLYNLYGPTEATVNCTYFTFPKGFNEPKAPIGIPILNYEIFILDEKMQEVPRGEVGEIYIGGTKPVVGRGYWNRPELTAERFVTRTASPCIPISQPADTQKEKSRTNSPCYRTGDLARWQPDGNIEFLGRSDFQVKFRGYRIELGEIETAIANHPAVRETVVVLKNQHVVNEGKLVAYIVQNQGLVLTISDIHDFLSANLPAYMLPSHVVFLEKIPLTTNGKIDRKALPDPANDRPELAQNFEAPQGELERIFTEKWEELLQVSPIGRHDKFFELGGNSILAAKFIGSLMTACEASIFITTIFDHPTVAGYAAFFEENYPNLLPRLLEDTVHIYNPTTGGVAGNSRSSKNNEGFPNSKNLVTLTPSDIADFKKIVPIHLPPIVSRQSSIVNSQAPIFILAPPRSGTTLLRVMLAGHPGLFACNELQLLHFETLAERNEAYQGKFTLWSEGLIRAIMELKNCPAEDAKALLHSFEAEGVTTAEMFAKLQEWVGGDRLIVDKSPSYALDGLALEKALADFPNARFIHLVRHPYSMVRSFEKYHMDQVLYLHPHNFTPKQLGELVWLESHRNTVEILEKVPSDRQFRMEYEDLVQQPEANMRAMCRALDIPFHEGLLNPYQDLDKKMTDGIHRDSRSMGDTHFDQKKKIDAGKAQDWKGVLEDNFLCEATWETAQQLGYQGIDDLRFTIDDSGVASVEENRQSSIDQSLIAIIGMSCRLPGANSVEEFWQNLVEGKDVSHLVTDADIDAEGIIVNRKSKIVNRAYALSDPYAFDAAFFGYHLKEAEMMDPQHRHFLETAHEALESAGYDPYSFGGKIGVFGGVARNTYALNNLLTNKDLLEKSGGWYQEMLASDSSFSITRVAYKLNLRGPAVNVQTACSTGGVAVHLACQSLLAGDSDMVLVGGGRVQAPVNGGYEHIEGGPLSADGYCRAFDAGANGMVQGHGMAMLVLKKLDKAIEDGDHVWAVIKSSAINNDGSDKTGITAPSSKGQADVIQKAIEKAGLTSNQISYFETHGTGTFIGDPIEIQGLTEAVTRTASPCVSVSNASQSFDEKARTGSPCYIGSVKTNIGHLDAGACIVGIIKTALALHHEQLPATLHFEKNNPQIDFKNTPFEVNAELRPWQRSEKPRFAGVSSFGLGGTNAHVILGEAPVSVGSSELAVGSPQLLPLSAKTDEVLAKLTDRITYFFEINKQVPIADAAFTLATGRQHFAKRNALLVGGGEGKQEVIKATSLIPHSSSLVFMFPGGGAQYVDMARDLYETNLFFRQQVDTCFTILEQHHGLDIKDLIFPKEKNEADETVLQNPAAGLASLFTIEYSLAKLWQHWGIQPAELIGHSMGEYTAACIAGVMSLEAALGLVTVRGKLFETLEGDGCMMSVAATEDLLRPFLDANHTISVINKIDSLVVSGTASAIDQLQESLKTAGVDCSKIHIKVPAHSPLIDPILPQFRKYLEGVELHAPKIPMVSNVTGTWLTADETTSVDYWLRHLRQPVRFADGLATLAAQSPIINHQSQNKNRIFLEVGPGQTLSTFARALPTLPGEARTILASVRHPKEVRNDVAFILKTLGKLWVNGVDVDWQAFYEGEKHRRMPLPTYPFERKKYFIAPKRATELQFGGSQEFEKITALTKPPAELEFGGTTAMTDTITSRIPNLIAEIKASLHELSGMEPAQMDASASFLELGFDSLFLSQAIIRFNQKFKLDLSFRVLFEDAPTIEELAEFVDELLPAGIFAPAVLPLTPKGEPNSTIPSQIAQVENGSGIYQQPMQQFSAENSPAIQQIINQQLQLMQQQLALLQGQPLAQANVQPSVTQPVSQPTALSNPQIHESSNPQPEVEIQRSTKGVTAKLNSYKKISTGDDLSEKQRAGLQDFMQQYEAMTPKSKAMAQRHRQYYADPRSVTGFSKLWKEVCYQIAHERSKGAHIWDVDGNEYVDYVMSYGVALFGHMPDFVEKAAAAAIQRGNSIDLLPPEATEIARMICEMTGYDRVTLANTGTEAVLGAVRAARTATGRDKIAVFDTDYHGMIDQFMVRGVHFKSRPDGSGGESKTMPSSPGVPKFLVENTLVLDYDDPEVLQKLAHQIGELAAVVIEPVQAQNPHWQHGELIKAIRKITEQNGVALIFDEIINGFRLDQRGAQAWYGVDADISAYGKSISGGFPLAAVAGKEKYMSAFDGGYWGYGDDSSPDGVIAYFASTFIKNPISVAAAHAALSEIQRLGTSMQVDLNEKTARFAERISEIFLRKKAPLMIQSASSFFMIKNADASPLSRLFNYVLRTKGINIRERPCFISTAHTEADFERTYIGFEDAIDEMFVLGLMEPWEGEDLNVIVVPPNSSSVEVESNIEVGIIESISSAELEFGGTFPTTEGQQEIFLSDQFSPAASKAYNIATEIRLEGEFDEAKMRTSLQALVDRHEALRTVFSADGKTMTVLPKLEIKVPLVDVTRTASPCADSNELTDRKTQNGEARTDSPCYGLHNEEAEHLFDLQNGPLVRFKIVKLEAQAHLVFINVHHIICDGWSLGILTKELGELYGSDFPSFENLKSLGSCKQLSQFATEQADLQQFDAFFKNEKYWLEQFRDAVPALDLPTDFPRPPIKTFNGAVEKISFDEEFTNQIRKAAAKQGSTFYVFMLAAYKAYLSRISRQEDIVVGVAAAGHNLPGNANLVAHAISLLPVRSKVKSDGPFGDFLKTVRKQVLDAFDHQQYTFGALVKKLKIGRNASRNTLISVAFNLDSPLENLKFGSLNATTRAIPRHYETFDSFINLKPLGSTIDFEWNFNTDLFRRESIRLRLAEFEVFLRSIVETCAELEFGGTIGRLSLLPDFEKKRLEQFGRGEVCNDFPLNSTLHELFKKQVERTPEKIAVKFDNQSLSYRQLNDKADALAAHLLENGLQTGAFVGLCMERSLDMMVSIYAILKTGCAYVPIDPRNPQERIRLTLEDAGCTHLVGPTPTLPQGEGAETYLKVQVSVLDKLADAISPSLGEGKGEAAYVIYTSGSTGKPKGVVISHANAINTLFAINKQLEMNELDTVFSVSSMAFDMSIPDYFLTMITGATLVLAGEETKKDGFALREEIETYRPTVMQATPTTWKILLMSGWKGDTNLRAIAGGEAFSKELAAKMMHCCGKVWNGYGPTETTIYATWQLISEEHLATCPGEFAAIGAPIANVKMLILDKNGEQVPVGVPGELFIGGNGVAAGYLNRPELTAERFVTRTDRPCYKTGDLVRYLPTGEIEFLGRIDDQVKIRGYRVELGEIEETMKQFPGVYQSVVNVLNDTMDSQRLVGYVVENGVPLDEGWEARLKDFLRSKMPGYMVPSSFIKMDAFPQNTSLKVDRKALPKPDLTILSGEYQSPSTPGEKLLEALWKELLGVEKIGVNDDFFELGGHSLAAVQMMTKIKMQTGVKLPLTTLFQHSTLGKLAVQLNGFNHKGHSRMAENKEFTSLVPIREGGSKPTLYLVHGGGLHVLFYQNMVKYMDGDQPIFALQARGLNGEEEPLDRIEDMAAHYISEMMRQNPTGPYCLAGYSLGGIIAWEMAKQLKAMGKEVHMLSLFDAVAKDEWTGSGAVGGFNKKMKKIGYNLSLLMKDPAKTFEYKTHVLKMQFEQKKGRLRTAFRNSETNEIEEGYIPYGSKVYDKSIEAYQKYVLQPLDVQVDLFKAKEQMFYLHDPVNYGWDKFALGGVITHDIGGNHLTLFDEPHGRQVAEVMKQRMEEVGCVEKAG